MLKSPNVFVRPESTVNFRTGKRVPRTNITCALFDRSSNVLTVSYTVHIRCVRLTEKACKRYIEPGSYAEPSNFLHFVMRW